MFDIIFQTDCLYYFPFFLNIFIHFAKLFIKYVINKKSVFKVANILPSIGRRDMCNSLLESPNRDASNGGIFVSLASIDAETDAEILETQKHEYFGIYQC